VVLGALCVLGRGGRLRVRRGRIVSIVGKDSVVGGVKGCGDGF